MPDAQPRSTEALPDGLTQVVRAAGLMPMSFAVNLFQYLTTSAPSIIFSVSNNTSGLFIQPVIPTPIRASLSVISFVDSDTYLKSVYDACTVARIEATLHCCRKISFV